MLFKRTAYALLLLSLTATCLAFAFPDLVPFIFSSSKQSARQSSLRGAGTLVFHRISVNARERASVPLPAGGGAFCRATAFHRRALVTAGHCGAYFLHRMKGMDPKLSSAVSVRIVDKEGKKLRSFDDESSYYLVSSKKKASPWRISFVPDDLRIEPKEIDSFVVPTRFALHDAGRTRYQMTAMEDFSRTLRDQCSSGTPPMLRPASALSKLIVEAGDHMLSYGRRRSDEEARDLCVMKLSGALPGGAIATLTGASATEGSAAGSLEVAVRRPRLDEDSPRPYPEAWGHLSPSKMRLSSVSHESSEDPLYEGAYLHTLFAQNPTGACSGDSGSGVIDPSSGKLVGVLSSHDSSVEVPVPDRDRYILNSCSCGYDMRNADKDVFVECHQRPKESPTRAHMAALGSLCHRQVTAASVHGAYFRTLLQDAHQLLRLDQTTQRQDWLANLASVLD